MQASASTYFDFTDNGRSVLALRGLVGEAFGVNNQFSLPPDQRFYAGGSGTVRGYRYQSIGPQFPDNNPTGGTAVSAGTVEYRQRILDKFGVVAFVDAGQVADRAACSLRMARRRGIGGRYYTAIGPIRLTWRCRSTSSRVATPSGVHRHRAGVLMRRAAKWLGWLLAAVVAIPVLLLAAGNLDPGRHLIERLTPTLTGGTIEIAGLAGRFPDALRVARVELHDPDGAYLTLTMSISTGRHCSCCIRVGDRRLDVRTPRCSVCRHRVPAAATLPVSVVLRAFHLVVST
jgi:hypothetical protein